MEPGLRGRTLLVATHRPALLQWVDSILVLNQGKVVMAGPKADILARLNRSDGPGPAIVRSGRAV